jgi:hypothetical protein
VEKVRWRRKSSEEQGYMGSCREKTGVAGVKVMFGKRVPDEHIGQSRHSKLISESFGPHRLNQSDMRHFSTNHLISLCRSTQNNQFGTKPRQPGITSVIAQPPAYLISQFSLAAHNL